MMEIKKEREAFEAWHYEQYLRENPNIDITHAKYIYDYAHKNALVWQLKESHFTAWQAAQAQAIPDGYVLMPIKPTETMVMAVVKEHEGDAFLPYSLYDAYVKQAMIEAQEQAKAQADAPGQITVTHERFQELIAIGVKAALDEREQK